jgi:hypothetical protein
MNLRPSSTAVPGGSRRAAFTLIETALALLAIGLGLLALFGLGRLGLQATKESEHDQRCALMADAVFETLREANMRFVDEARTNRLQQSWYDRWATTVQNGDQIPFPPVAGMCTSRDTPPNRTLHLTFNTELAEAFLPDELVLTEWNPRYKLALYPKYDASHVAGGHNLFLVTLVIYPDGDTYSSEYRVFQTTLSNPGGLP